MKSTFTHVITCFDFFFSLTVDSLLNARGNNIRKKSREAHLADFKTSFLFSNGYLILKKNYSRHLMQNG